MGLYMQRFLSLSEISELLFVPDFHTGTYQCIFSNGISLFRFQEVYRHF
jgi:hypothetical protein